MLECLKLQSLQQTTKKISTCAKTVAQTPNILKKKNNNNFESFHIYQDFTKIGKLTSHLRVEKIWYSLPHKTLKNFKNYFYGCPLCIFTCKKKKAKKKQCGEKRI